MAGAGYKLFNTGDVLTAAQVNTYLQEQAVMRFADATARTTALSGVLAEGMVSYLQDTDAVEVYNGTAWVSVATGDITGITTGATSGLTGGVTSGTADLKFNTTAKGGLLVGTGSGTVSELAVGSNTQVLTADSTTATGLKWAAAGGSAPTLVDYTPTLTNWTLGNGSAIYKWYDASSTMFYLYVAITLGSTSTISGSLRVSFPATIASNAGSTLAFQGNYGKYADTSASREYTCLVGGASDTNMQWNLIDDPSYVTATTAVFDGSTPVAWGAGDQLFVQGWYRKA